MSKIKKFIYLTCIPTLVLLLLIEFAIRIHKFGFDAAISPAIMNSLFGKPEYFQKSKFPEIVYELRPNLNTIFAKVPFRTNKFGMRDKDFSKSKPETIIRYACVGDSLTMGRGVKLSGVFHTRLEDRMNHEMKPKKFEFLNFGVGGYDLRQYIGVIKEKVLKFDPDYIILGFCGNDTIIQPDDYYKPRTFSGNHYGNLFLHSWTKEWIHERYIRLRKYNNKEMIVKKEKQTNELISIKPISDYLYEKLNVVAKISKKTKIPIIIVHLTYNGGEIVINNKLKEVCRSLDIPFLNTGNFFPNDPVGNYIKYCIFRHDGHPNSDANEIFADKIFDFIKNNKFYN